MRSKILCAISASLLCLAALPVFGADAKPPILVEVTMPGLESGAVGELVGESSTSITVRDLKSDKERTFSKTDVKKITRDLSDDQAIADSDLFSVIAWKVRNLSGTAPLQAKVAKISDATIYLTIGSKAGLVEGEKLTVFRVLGDIKDPATGKVIAQERPKIAQIQVSEVQEAYSKAKLIGNMETQLAVGDEVETTPLKVSVAVIPLLDTDGKSNAVGISAAEDLTTALVSKKIAVVERNVLVNVLKELSLQYTDLVDPATVQRLGKQIGASTVLTGTIVPDGAHTKMHIRLIEVETGKVLLAAAQTRTGTVTAAGLGGTSGSGASGNAAAVGIMAGLDVLATGNKMPAYLLSNASVSTTKEGLVIASSNNVRTRDGTLLNKDFVFDVLLSPRKEGNDGCTRVGIGDGDFHSYGEIPDAVFLRIQEPGTDHGQVDLTNFRSSNKIDNIPNAGTHMVRIEKTGDSVTFSICIDYNGTFKADISKTIPDIKAAAPLLKDRTTFAFIEGPAVFKAVRFEIKPSK